MKQNRDILARNDLTGRSAHTLNQPIMLTIVGLSIALLVSIVSFLYSFRGDLDTASFIISKASLAFMPTTFPGNSSVEAQIWRKLFSLGSFRFNILPFMNTSDILVANTMYPGERKLVRVYNGNLTEKNRDVLVFYFAGAWMLGSVDDNDKILRTIALQTNFVVVGIEYSLAPEFPYPRGFHDALHGLQWVKHNIARYGGNPNHIFVTGESAGGNLAAAVVARNLAMVAEEDRVSVVGVVLVYPPTAANFQTESYVKYARFNGILTSAEMQHAWSLYSGGCQIPDDDYTYQPLHTPDSILSRFPHTEIIAAEYDVLRDDSVLFAARLHELGVPGGLVMYNSTIHGFFGREFSPAGYEALKHMCDKMLEVSATLVRK